MDNKLLDYVNNQAKNMGFGDTFYNKLNTSNNILNNMYNTDAESQRSQLNQVISDYERERQKQDEGFNKEAQSAYIDYAKSINPYSTQNSNMNRIGLGGSGYNESSLINANNTYQNRYTNTKNNYENIFADINNNVNKAKEQSNVKLAELAKTYQDRMLENLWRLNDEQIAERQREEEKRRWEAEMALQKQQLATQKARSRSSGSGGITFGDSSTFEPNTVNNSQNILADLYQGYSASLNNAKNSGVSGNTFNTMKQQIANNIENVMNAGKISKQEALSLLGQLGL